ncbi:MAG: hypothetical protein PW786_01840 [Arachidicoccus sp.]|nr:hypothetical protein [Arachidicoccus sp.]
MNKRIIFIIAFLLPLIMVSAQLQKPERLQDSMPVVDSSVVLLTRTHFVNPMQDYRFFNQMGIMCRAEYTMQKKIKIPLCFRIGNLEECKKRETLPLRYP